MQVRTIQLQVNRGFLLSVLIALFSVFSAGSCIGEELGAFRVVTEEFPPYNYTTDDGAIVGISTEIVREILRRTGQPDRIEVMPWVDGYRLAREEDNIVLFSTTRSPMREKLFKWVGPLVPNNLAFFARKGSGISITSLEEAKKVKAIGVYKDDFGELLLQEKGFTNLDAVIENSLNIPRLLQGEIDLWIANELTGKHMIAKAGAGHRIETVFEVQKDYMSIAFSRNTPDELVAQWQRTLDEIKSDGTYAQIFSQWLMFSYTDDLKPVKKRPKLKLSAEEKAWIDTHSVVRIAADPDYAPFQFRNAAGDSEGVANDFLAIITQKLGIRFEYLQPGSWAQSLQLVKERKADMVAVATQTPERQEYLRFTAPYVEFPDVVITRAGHTIASLAELNGMKLATIKGFAINEYMRKNHPAIRLLMAPDVKSQLQMVSTGEADAAVMNLATTTYTITKWKITNLHINNLTGFTYKLAFASRKDWPMLNRLLEKAISSISEAERQRILRKWITVSLEEKKASAEIELTAEERQWIAEHPVILGAADPDWPPMEYLDRNGRFTGMVADYMALVEQRLGFSIEMVPQENWSEALRSVRERDVSLLTAAARTPDRDKYLSYTEPYLELPAVIIVNDSASDISGMADLGGKRVAVVKDYGTHDYLLRNYPHFELVPVADIRSGLYAVSHGKVDAFVANIASASYYIEKYAIQNLNVADKSGYRYALGIASRNDWPILNRILQKGVASITKEERQAIYRKWIGLRSEAWEPSREQLITFAVILIIIGFGITLFWNRLLRRKVDARTRELQASEQEFRNLYNTALVGLYRTSVDGNRVLAANPALYEQFGYDSMDEFVEGSNVNDIYVEPERRDTLLKMLREHGKVDNFEFLGRRRDGSIRDFLLSGTLYEEQGYLEGAVLDITDRKKAEEEAREAREAAERANRAKSDFLATMSHELRTPMNAVLGLSHLALLQDVSVQQRDYLNSIQMAARSLLGVINDVLDLSKVEAGRLELERIEFDLDQVLENAAVVTGHEAAGKGLDFAIFVRREVPHRFVGDPQRLGQILLNLAGNAVKFTEKGSVEISVSMQEYDDARGCLRFDVRDSGIGMSEEQTRTIFDAFTQGDSSTTRRYGGTGLGLNISNLLTKMMGGELSVASTAGQGSTFTFTASLELPQQTHRHTDDDRVLYDSRLLVSSSDPVALCGLTELLERAGSSVVGIDDASRMMTTESSGSLPYDLIVFDARGERGDGWSRLQPLLPAMAKVLVLSEQEFMQCDDPRVTCVQAPLTPFTLVRAVAKTLGIALPGRGDDSPGRAQAKLEGSRVLLVEDNPVNQQVGEELLAARGVDVTVAQSGKAALETLDAETFDLVLMDIQMPDMSGYEVTEILRRDPRFDKVPVVAMTAHALKDARDAAVAAGMNDFLAKPIDPERFYSVVDNYLKLPEMKEISSGAKEQAEDRFGELPGIDPADGLHHTGGNVALYVKLLHDFKQRHGDDAEILKDLCEQGDEQEARRLAHTLKGAAGNLGAKSLYLACRKIEERITTGDITMELNVLQYKLDQVMTTISQLPDSVEPGAESADHNHPLWSELVTEASRLLNQGNMRAVDMVPPIRYHAGIQCPDLVSEFEAMVEHYHFDSALRVLNQLDSVMQGKEPKAS